MTKLLLILFLLLVGCPTKNQLDSIDKNLLETRAILNCMVDISDEAVRKFKLKVCVFYNRNPGCLFTRDEATKVSNYYYYQCMVKELTKDD